MKKETRRRPLEGLAGQVDEAWFKAQLESIDRTQTWLAEQLGLHRPAITRMFQGGRRMHLDEAIKIAGFFGVTVDEVLRRAGIAGAEGEVEAEGTVTLAGWVDSTGRIRKGPPPRGPKRAPAFEGCEAYRLDGETFGPMAGGVVYVKGGSTGVSPDVVGRLSVVEIRGKEGLWLRVPERGYRAGTFHLKLLGGGVAETDAALVNAVAVLGMRF